MAQYKSSTYLFQSDNAAFDKIYDPGTPAPDAGIYRCIACGHEIGIAQGHTLPPQNHHTHEPNVGKIRWQLIVYAQHLIKIGVPGRV